MDNILEFFIREPEKEFHVREIAKILYKSPTTVSKYLKEYEKKGILKSERRLNHLLFKADTKNRAFKQEKLSYNLSMMASSGLIEYLEREFRYPKAIVLFGSFAKAEDIPSSDVDILVISPIKKELNLEKYEKNTKHKIQLFVYSDEDIKRMQKKNKELLNNMLNGIVLYGFWEVLR